MTKHEKKVIEALNTIVDKKRKVRDATKDEHEKERLNTEIIGFLDCIYILTDDNYLNDLLRIYKDF